MTGRTLARQVSLPERKAPASPSVTRSARPGSASAGQSLQRQLGNQGTAAFVARSGLSISSPHDRAEREAVSTAAAVMRATAPAAAGGAGVQPAAPAADLQRQPAGPSPAPVVSHQLQAQLSGGDPLPAGVRGFMEPRFQADFGGVRIHTSAQAASLAASLDAHAFTVGGHVFFGQGRFEPDTQSGKELIAHELTHTIQQGAAVQRSAVDGGGGVPGAPVVQRQERGLWESLTDWGDALAWDMVDQVAPDAAPILRKGPAGVTDWMGEKVSAAANAAFDALVAPVRAVTGVGQTLSTLFAPMLVALQVAASQIARNDCSPLRDAADKLQKTAEKIVTPIVEKLQPVVVKVKEFLSGLWDKIGAPIWGWIQSYAKEQWRQIEWLIGVVKGFYAWIWEKTAWVRDMAARAWTWVKNKLGIGEGPEGQDGLLQWVECKAEAAWQLLKATIEPFKKELTTIGITIAAVAVALSPAGPVLAIGAAVVGAVKGLRWLADNWGQGGAWIQARAYLERSLFPQLSQAAHQLAGAVARLVGAISGALGSLAAALGRAVSSLAASVLRLLAAGLRWLADEAQALADWATQKLDALSTWLHQAVDKLHGFLDQILALLSRVGAVVADVYGLPLMLAEKVWKLVPACIRDPIVDFLVPIILRQIELFRELVKDNDAWQKTKADVMRIVQLVFKDHDLVGAVKAVFQLVLRAFNIPVELLTGIARKAMQAWDLVSKKPLEFIKNVVRAIGHGFKLLKDNFLVHLRYGLEGWLFGELQEKKISPPRSWTDVRAVFGFVLDVLGLSVNHVYELLKTRFEPAKVDALRKRIGQVASVLSWVDKAIDTTKTPAENAVALVQRGKEFGKQVLTGIAEWVATQVAEELAILAASAAASGGLSEILDVARRVYKILLSVKRYLAGILRMVSDTLDEVTDLASGKIEAVGAKFEGILHRGMPIVIGFLAEQVGLGSVGEAMRDIVDRLREMVDEALLWLIDTIKAAIDAVIGLVQAGVKKLKEWWRREIPLPGDDEPHTLKFQGTEANARLMVWSSARPVPEFVQQFLTVEGTAKQIEQARQLDLEIMATQRKLVEATRDGEEDEADRLTDELDQQLDELAELLVSLMEVGADEGSEKKPLLIDYPKRRAAAYTDIFVGPRVGEGVRINQDWLRPLVGRSNKQAKAELLRQKPTLADNDEFQRWTGSVRQLSPTKQGQDVDGKEVGLSPQFASIGPGVVLVYAEKEGTGGGGKINDCFKPYGFVPSSKGGEGLDGDHVMERQLGGPDELENLWPLERSENRSSGSLVKSIEVVFRGKQMNVHTAREKRKGKVLYLLIRSVRAED